ncbi:MAG: MarR family transcriptional regulator [Alicyclobacillus sp.]|nr:MarR family transcriptional regulator [Alicyclobacillus sp.]
MDWRPDNLNTLDAVEHLADCLQAIQRHLRRNTKEQPNLPGLTRVQWMILRHVERHPDCSVGQLADRLDVRPSTMSQMIDRLELAGWVQRCTDARDGRSRLVRLTAAGAAALRSQRDLRVQLLAEPFQQLNPEEQACLLSLLDKLVSRMGKGGSSHAG